MSERDAIRAFSHMLETIFVRMRAEGTGSQTDAMQRWLDLYNVGSLPIDKKSYKALRLMDRETTDQQKEDATCAICLDNLQNNVDIPEDHVIKEELKIDPTTFGTTVIVMPCKHRFHYFCLTLWLEAQQTCPTCRQKVKTDKEVEEEERQRNLEELHDSMYG
ncbi:putative RING finger protein ZK637.14 [Caenorhabditis elegans]|uniref:Uncharacterized RING finger protein ZK637.14 n=1 Tax=Caenorhabditis elegans TaxID=6239 RepID=YOUD_CAEEL|nr:putative RING finger protein ZK637.14 [Caenorhabditis elegans]P30631.2 RecName: Full=Uncharacterized RING finger protein ZK637.14 [Caenorhabditis elegans]CAA77447.1 Uncharacterized RING finger protein ZK637.14 [Caenorhabditis elegans]|eukprot:NP_498962.1 Uncharacterized RING finger protein ZK637.14 [Caenorhabditis elegans]